MRLQFYVLFYFLALFDSKANEKKKKEGNKKETQLPMFSLGEY